MPPALRILLLLLLSNLALAQGAPRRLDEKPAVRDGVKLATTVHLPPGDGRWPVILTRTPYGRGGMDGFAKRFVDRGYAFVSQDCRGRFDSEGTYLPFFDDPHDGYDAVEWVAAQPWSNGKVGMLGGSALGITAHLAATQEPPHLLCAYVAVAPSSARTQTIYAGGVYRKELNDGWLMSQKVPQAIGETISHPAADPHWDYREIPSFHARMRIPIYEVSGWFDIFAQGALDNFSGLQARGAGVAAGNQKLLMGPWAHGPLNGRLRYPNDDAGAVFGKECDRWFDRWLKSEQNGIDREPPVRYYVLGDGEPGAAGNEWRTAESWPPPSRATSLFLHAGGGLRREPAGDSEQSIAYTYDPASPVPTKGGGNLFLPRGPLDQREIGDREDYLRFVTEPLAEPLEVAGRIHADLYIESDAPDTDFVAKLVDVHPDGYEALLADGIIRARYREGLEREVFLEPGKVAHVRIDLWSTAAAFARGHRIAVHVTSSNDPRFDPNPNTGKPLRADVEKKAARNRVHMDAGHPSRVVLPVVRGAPAGRSF